MGVCCRKLINPWAGIPTSEIRASLEQQWKDDTELESELVWNDTAEGYLLLDDKIHRRKFCICPHGFPTNTVLIADSIRYGCIPGTISFILIQTYAKHAKSSILFSSSGFLFSIFKTNKQPNICPWWCFYESLRSYLYKLHGLPILWSSWLEKNFNNIGRGGWCESAQGRSKRHTKSKFHRNAKQLTQGKVFVKQHVLYLIEMKHACEIHEIWKRVSFENQVQKHFQWNSPPLRFDAFNMVMYDLSVVAHFWLQYQVEILCILQRGD